MREEEAIVLVMALVILAGATLMMVALVNRRKMREMEHRERLAMIERGLTPSSELAVPRFEPSAGYTGPRASVPPPSATAIRYRTAGVLLIGFGLGLMLLIGVTAGEVEVGVGIGGAWAILGAASLLNYFLMLRRDDQRGSAAPAPWTPPSSGHSQEPPSNVAP